MSDRRTYADRAEYLKKAVAKRRKDMRKKLIDDKGGQCSICGYAKCTQALELHHHDSTQKDFGLLSHGLTRSWEK